MATALMASCSVSAGGFLRRSSHSTPKAIHAQIGGGGEKPPCPIVLRRITALLNPAAAAAAAASLAMAAIPMPAVAAEIEKAALFDFNLTLPAIALEFLLLMVALDKLYFTPLGKFMDERDASIRAQLGDVKDVSGEVKQLEEQAAAVLKAARAEVSAALNQMKRETTAELEASFAEQKKKVEEELVKALAALENQKEETLKSLDSQIDLLSSEIVSKVLPSAN
ncbi:hypothetical protein KSP39_PZI018266 [Platanthera zijinensis]|uniref:ATP synthase subunit b', chloroplastic n=1 Tax=Platanthera zijinensis TaxID=2320716 RepID=A0AAP0FYJ8_9ASPA